MDHFPILYRWFSLRYVSQSTGNHINPILYPRKTTINHIQGPSGFDWAKTLPTKDASARKDPSRCRKNVGDSWNHLKKISFRWFFIGTCIEKMTNHLEITHRGFYGTLSKKCNSQWSIKKCWEVPSPHVLKNCSVWFPEGRCLISHGKWWKCDEISHWILGRQLKRTGFLGP